ncbi:MAG: NAD(P)H-dependent oxidoreductase [Pisciglobus halotolerans]|nr:NAD(P)H-dependent oxidoreductase [Pisciglobus halotolerans]
MKTLIIISHPELADSGSQQYLLSSVPQEESVRVHHLESSYPDGKIDVAYEQKLLIEHDRILFQFPFYWYSSPPLLKKWQDDVLEYGFAYGTKKGQLKDKEFGLILSVGVRKGAYQTGGKEGFSISELTKPYQALAFKIGMQYLEPLVIYQFAYMQEEQKMQLLIEYQQMLTSKREKSLAVREKWVVQELEKTDEQFLNPGDKDVIQQAIDQIEENRETIDDLDTVLEQIYDG